jgi:hypothetical protein
MPNLDLGYFAGLSGPCQFYFDHTIRHTRYRNRYAPKLMFVFGILVESI